MSWPVTDGLGREAPVASEAGKPRPDRFVGIFYFLWAGQHDDTEASPSNVSKILAAHPDAVKSPASPPWAPLGTPNYWGEPLFGFYLNSDPWILRRHVNLLVDAGVDTLIFDTTNRVTYHDVYMNLCKVFRQMRAEGERTPQIVFVVNTDAGETAQELYEELYKPGLYDELWFRWQGKPLLICDPEKASPELRNFFTLRRAHWPFEQINTPYAWHWEAAYPQPYGFTDDPKRPEEVNVSVAQNLRQSDGKVTNMSYGDARGRSFHEGKTDTRPNAVNFGFNFAEQWERALALAPPFVMVTGWNEWMVGRSVRDNHSVFVDEMTEEFSRDIEPMKDGHLDHYYYQFVSNVRRFKGTPEILPAGAMKVIDVNGSFGQWRDVVPNYLDHTRETEPRDYPGVGKVRYVNRTGRNDFELMKVSRDEHNIYFYARTREPITAWNGGSWMMLLIRTGGASKGRWDGYDYIVNRTVVDRNHTLVEKSRGGWNWTKAAEVSYTVRNNEIQIAVPREALGLPAGDAVSFDFKWVDNMQVAGDPMEFYLSGDTAPDGRFRYRYQTKPKAE